MHRLESAAAHQAIYEAIVRAADAGLACPSNDELCWIAGASSVSYGAEALARLERRGLILVERFTCARQVTIVATGKRTAHQGRRDPHWRLRDVAGLVAVASPGQAVPGQASLLSDAEVERRRVTRDPCPRCGTRADIGCGHPHVRLSMGAFA